MIKKFKPICFVFVFLFSSNLGLWQSLAQLIIRVRNVDRVGNPIKFTFKALFPVLVSLGKGYGTYFNLVISDILFVGALGGKFVSLVYGCMLIW